MAREKLGSIPPDVRVLTHNAFIPQTCNRKYVYQFNYSSDPTKIEQAKGYQADYIIWDLRCWEPNTLSLKKTLVDARTAGYSVSFEQDGFYILQRVS
jgi:uncharacterized membrane protein